MEHVLTQQFNSARGELASYLCRMVLRPQVAEDLVQTTYLRCLEAMDRLPSSHEGVRAWLFKVASNLAVDELRRHGHWRETMLSDLREIATEDEDFQARSRAMAGNPETKAIAREHLVACMACTLRNLPHLKAAALLLKEVHGFSVSETAQILDVTPVQIKNWLQQARGYMTQRYGSTCALIVKEGVCHQCVELDGYMASGQGSPVTTDTSLEHRLELARYSNQQTWGAWHKIMFQLIDDLA